MNYKTILDKSSSMLANIKVKNPDLQLEIDKLKKEYDSELTELKSRHKQEKKTLFRRALYVCRLMRI